MSTFEFGLTLLVTGMGGTLATLWVLTLIISALTRHLPVRGQWTGHDPGIQNRFRARRGTA